MSTGKSNVNFKWVDLWADPKTKGSCSVTEAVQSRFDKPARLNGGKRLTYWIKLPHIVGDSTTKTELRIVIERDRLMDMWQNSHSTLSGLLPLWLKHKARKGVQDQTITQQESRVNSVINLYANRLLDDFTVRKYHKTLENALDEGLTMKGNKPYSGSYKRNLYCAVADLLDWAEGEEYAINTLAKHKCPSWPEEHGIPFTIDEARILVHNDARFYDGALAKMIEAQSFYEKHNHVITHAAEDLGVSRRTMRHRLTPLVNPHWLWSCIMIYTGLRSSMAAALRWEQIKKRRHSYYIVIAKGELFNKTKRTITIPLQLELEHILFGDGDGQIGIWNEDTMASTDRIAHEVALSYDKRDNNHVTARNGALKRMMAHLGIKRTTERRLRTHSCRHTYATIAASIGTPQHELGLAVGHTESATTERYIENRTEHIMQAEDEGWGAKHNDEEGLYDFYLRRTPPDGYIT